MSIPTPLSIFPYRSRFNLDVTYATYVFENTFKYVNMSYHGFYGGTSLQSQELNELQENIYNQLSLANTMSGNWLQYNNNVNQHGASGGGMLNYDNSNIPNRLLDVFIPLEVNGITYVHN